MDEGERTQLVAQYRDGYRAIAEALRMRRKNSTRAPARSGGRRATSSTTLPTARCRRHACQLLAEDHPTFQRSDQDAYARRLHYDRPHESSLELFRYAREATAELLERMSPEDWAREGIHSTAGPFGAERWLQIYSGHAHKHARQIRAARDGAEKK